MKSKHISTPTKYNENNSSQINNNVTYQNKLLSSPTHSQNAFSSPFDTSPNEQKRSNEKICSSKRNLQKLSSTRKFAKERTLSINRPPNISTSQIQHFYSHALDESPFSSIDEFRRRHKISDTLLISQSSESSSSSLVRNCTSSRFLLENLHNYTARLEWRHVYVYLASKH
jgi:hypothetical protein